MQLLLVQPELSYDPGRDNAGAILRLLEPHAAALAQDDIVLLPEHFDLRPERRDYEQSIVGMAQRLGCHVVGGSHHEDRGTERVNSGIVADASGAVLGRYEKLRPYADERSRVKDGSLLGEFSIGGRHVLVLICADFWFSDVFYRATALPDLVLVPAFSVTRKPTPDYSRALWRHLAITRAYEFGAFVGISDWAHTESGDHLSPSGVAGFADPTPSSPDHFFHPTAGAMSRHSLDFAALARFRNDRMARGFFWKRPPAVG